MLTGVEIEKNIDSDIVVILEIVSNVKTSPLEKLLLVVILNFEDHVYSDDVKIKIVH